MKFSIKDFFNKCEVCIVFFKITPRTQFVCKIHNYPIHFRSSHRKCSIKKGILKNFAKFTGKHLCQSLFFIFWRNFKNTFFTKHLRGTASVICNIFLSTSSLACSRRTRTLPRYLTPMDIIARLTFNLGEQQTQIKRAD